MKNDTRQRWREIWPVEWVSREIARKKREKSRAKLKVKQIENRPVILCLFFLHQAMQLLAKMCDCVYDFVMVLKAINTETVSRLFQSLHCDRVDALTRRRFYFVTTFATTTVAAVDTYTHKIYWLKLCRFIGPIAALGSFPLNLSSRECGKNHVN